MTKRYSVDRIVEGVLVLVPDEDGERQLTLDAKEYPYSPNDVLDVEIEDGAVASVTPLPQEREQRLKKNESRLHALFNRKKK